MASTYSTAIMLMLVGMITVFAMLVIVFLVGNMIISVTNSIYKEPDTPKIPVAKPVNIESQKLAAIVSSVNMVTSGKGRVISIEKIK